MKITKITPRQILDSRGHPTVEVDVEIEGGVVGRASVPSGASTGKYEAVELRDGGSTYLGQGVSKAIANIKDHIAPKLIGHNALDQSGIDKLMLELDGTDNKGRLGANAILAVSLATAKATAIGQNLPLYQYVANLAENNELSLPLPQMNIINGGKHASGALDIQELMIIPLGAGNFAQAVQMGSEVFLTLGQILKKAGYAITVGDEGGYAPPFKGGYSEALDCIIEAITQAGYKPGAEIALGMDVAASELIHDGKYKVEGSLKSTNEMIEWYQLIKQQYPLISLEDGLAEDEWDGWVHLTNQLGHDLQLVGDDLLVTNPKLIKKGIEQKAANAVLVKPNQIGTLTETIAAVKTAQSAGWRVVVSHRSGETEDTTIAHLAVGLGAGQIKTGSLSRSERTAKYNELIRIEQQLGSRAVLARPFKVLE